MHVSGFGLPPCLIPTINFSAGQLRYPEEMNFDLLRRKLEASLQDGTGVYIHAGEDANQRIAEIADDVRQNLCEPFALQAVVTGAGFPSEMQRPVGATVRGICVAYNAGYWLVYDEDRDEFMCFWGSSTEYLGAHGVFGSAAYCWTA